MKICGFEETRKQPARDNKLGRVETNALKPEVLKPLGNRYHTFFNALLIMINALRHFYGTD